MKTVMSVLVFCLLVNAVVCAEDAARAEKESVAEVSKKDDAAVSLLKTRKENVLNREVIGQGGNRDAAIRDGLYRAVEQVRGVKIDSGTYKFVFGGAGVGIGSEEAEQKRIEFDSVGVATRGTAYTTEIEGLVKSYEVLEESKTDEGIYQVKLAVAVYTAEDMIKRVKLALMPVKALQGNYSFLNLTVSGEALATLFGQRLGIGLMQTNKFAVLDRESVTDFAIEKEILLSHDASLGELANLSSTVGADYLLIGSISEAKIWRIDKQLKTAEYTTTEFKARITFNYRLVDSSTKQVVLASGVEKYLENEEVRALADERDPSEWDPAQLRDALLSLAANDVINAIVGRVSPIKVASIQSAGQIILNQGGKRMEKGMLLEIFTMGEEIFDVDTGESLGKVENRVATVEVQRVEPTMSFAEVVDGDLSKISEGLVCRIKKTKRSYEEGMKPDVIRTETGGVKLPFDKK